MNNSSKWELPTIDDKQATFNGLNVRSDTILVQVRYENADGSGPGPFIPLFPRKICLMCDRIILRFHSADLYNELECHKIYVSGVLKNTDTFAANDPGWGWRQRP